MKTKNDKQLRSYRSPGLGLATLILLLVGTGNAQQSYSVTDLGTLGGNNSIPFWITNGGDVVGIADTAATDSNGFPIDHAFRWSQGVMQDLGTLGGNSSLSSGANSDGQATGQADLPGGVATHAVLWDSKNAITDLGTLAGPSGNSGASVINSEHQVVGTSDTPEGEFHAVLWDKGLMTDLGTLGGPNSFGAGINELGQMAGGAQFSHVPNPILGFPPFHAVLWRNGTIIDLGDGGGGIGSAAANINNRSEIVGRFAVPDLTVGAVAHAFLWQGGSMQDLGVPEGDQDSEANSLNDKGQIVGDAGVGFIETYNPDRALLWQNGELTDLNTLIPADSGFQLIVAFDINAHGQIVACGVQTTTGNVHAVLLNPEEGGVGPANRAGTSRGRITLSEHARKLLASSKRGLL